MEKFVVNEKDPEYMMRHNLEELLLNIRKSKYNIILKFMNELFDKSHKSLRHFKIRTNFFKNKSSEDIEDTLKKYDSEFKKTIKFDICKYRSSNKKSPEKKGSGDKKNKYDIKLEIFEVISELLRSIEYSMIRNIIDEKDYYIILDKPPKKVRRNSG